MDKQRVFRGVIWASIAACGMAGQVFARDQYVMPKKDNVGVYRSEMRRVFETPVFTLSENDRALVLEAKGDRCRIRGAKGEEGWVEKAKCINISGGSIYQFEPETLVPDYGAHGFTSIVIDTEASEDAITLDRSFAIELRTNVDKNELSRQ